MFSLLFGIAFFTIFPCQLSCRKWKNDYSSFA